MSGRLGKADLAAAIDTDIYTAPVGIVATATVSFVNRSAAAVTVRLAARSAALANGDYLEYDTTLQPSGVLERSGIVLSPGEIITARASAVGVSVRAHGFEEAV